MLVYQRVGGVSKKLTHPKRKHQTVDLMAVTSRPMSHNGSAVCTNLKSDAEPMNQVGHAKCEMFINVPGSYFEDALGVSSRLVYMLCITLQ